MPLPPWRRYRTQPIDERDAVAYLAAAATADGIGGEALDIAGPEVLSYGAMIERIARAAAPAATGHRTPERLWRCSAARSRHGSAEPRTSCSAR